MKAVIVLADGTRYADEEIDDAALKRGYVEFRKSRRPVQQAEQVQPDPSEVAETAAPYAVCIHNDNEAGVPVFTERRLSRPPQRA